MQIESKKSNRGGIRQGAGRPVGSGKYKEPTELVSVPISVKSNIVNFLEAFQNSKLADTLDKHPRMELLNPNRKHIPRPLFSSKVRAGHPSPADDHIDDHIDPTDYIIDKEESSFLYTIEGLSMFDEGLVPGTIAVVDRSRIPVVGDIVLAHYNGYHTVKILGVSKDKRAKLVPSSSIEKFPIITVSEFDEFEIIGVINSWFKHRKKR